MLKSLRIKNFRSLTDFRVPRLGRVNLIVGKNNSGKSSILEALRIYSQNGNPLLLDEALIGHDEVLHSLSQSTPSSDDEQIAYQNFFSGRVFPERDGDEIYIGDLDENEYVRIAHTYYIEERVEKEGDDSPAFVATRRTPVSKAANHDEAEQALLVTTNRRENPRWIPIEAGALYGQRRAIRPAHLDPQSIPLGYIPTGFVPSARLAELWDSIALTSFDEIVRNGLRIIDPNVSGIAFVKRNSQRRNDSERAAIVKLEGDPRPLPLNSMGDGMVRILQLLLGLIPARAGIYLVDEFENGLHYSIQDKVWELIFQLAVTYDIQIFAVTHSWDCIEAFRNAAAKSGENSVLLRVGKSIKKSEQGRVIAITFEHDALVSLTQSDLELR